MTGNTGPKSFLRIMRILWVTSAVRRSVEIRSNLSQSLTTKQHRCAVLTSASNAIPPAAADSDDQRTISRIRIYSSPTVSCWVSGHKLPKMPSKDFVYVAAFNRQASLPSIHETPQTAPWTPHPHRISSTNIGSFPPVPGQPATIVGSCSATRLPVAHYREISLSRADSVTLFLWPIACDYLKYILWYSGTM